MPNLEEQIVLAVRGGADACIALAADLAASLPQNPKPKRCSESPVAPLAPLAELFHRLGTEGEIGVQNRLLALSRL
jgi:hypothetical protein